MAFLLYGAYGYTGELIAREALDRELDVIVAGRDSGRTDRLARDLGCESRDFPVESAEFHLDGVDAVLNCAGPFVNTYEPFIEACLQSETHYLDITGEVAVFEAIAERDREAERAGVCLLPGVGFEVVPTDCLAGHLHDRLPSATELRIGVDAAGPVSGGSLRTLIENVDEGGAVRRDGEIQSVPPGWKSREIDFGDGPRNAVTVPLGDVSTAYYTTGIENVEIYAAMPPATEQALRYSRRALPLLGLTAVKRSLQAAVDATVSGPSKRRRDRDISHVWGEATDGDRTVVSRLRTPNPYALTVDAATTAVERVLADPPVGFETPAAAFTPEFVLELDGVEGFFDD